MGVICNTTDEIKVLVYGNCKLVLKAGESMRVKGIKHGRTGDVFSEDELFKAYQRRYSTSGLLFLGDEDIDTGVLDEAKIDELSRKAKQEYVDALRALVRDFNALNIELSNAGKPPITPPKSLQYVIFRLKTLDPQPDVHEGFTPPADLERLRTHADTSASALMGKLRAMASANDVAGVMRALSQKGAPDAGSILETGLDRELLTPQAKRGRRREASEGPPAPPGTAAGGTE